MTLGYNCQPSDAPTMLLQCGGLAQGWPLVRQIGSKEVICICRVHGWKEVIRRAGYRDYLRDHEEVGKREETYRSPESIPDWAIDLFPDGQGEVVRQVRRLGPGRTEVVGVNRRKNNRTGRPGDTKPLGRGVKRDPGPQWGNAPGQSGALLGAWAAALTRKR